MLLSIAGPEFAKAAAGDLWDSKHPEGWISIDNDTYYERYKIVILSDGLGDTENEPIKITPWFPQGRATEESLRLIWQNSTSLANYTEIPFIINQTSKQMWDLTYIQQAEIIFVAPEVNPGKPFFLLFSENTSIDFPNAGAGYSISDYVSVDENQFSSFYDSGLIETKTLRFDQSENQSLEMIVPAPRASYDFSIDNASFDMEINPSFFTESNIELSNRFDGMGPASVKLIDGSIYGNDGTYLLIGGPNTCYIYNYSSTTGEFENLVNVSIQPDAISPQISGMTIGNVIDPLGSDPELVFGTKNGTIYIYTYDGSTAAPSLAQTFRINQSSQYYTESWGLTTMNIYNYTRTPTYTQPDLFAVGNGPDPYIQTFYSNNSMLDKYTTAGSYTINEYTGIDNYSMIAYSYEDHDPAVRANFYPSKYELEQGVASGDVDEALVVFPSASGGLSVGLYHPRFNTISQQTTIYPRLYASASKIFPYAELVNYAQGAGGVTYSKKFTSTNPTDTYALMAGGMSDWGDIYINWKDLSVIQNATTYYTVDQFTSGYSVLTSKGSIRIPSSELPYEYPSNDAVLVPVKGQIDGQNVGYDDVLFVDNYGQYYFLAFNGTEMEYILSNSLLGEEKDLYGTGQSIDAYDYTGDGISDIIVGDTDGYVHFLNFSFAENLRAYSRYGTAGNDLSLVDEFIETFGYTDNIRSISDMQNDFNQYLGNQTREGGSYLSFFVDVSLDAPGLLKASNPIIEFTTNDYLLVQTNRHVYQHLITIDDNDIEYIDYDEDGLFDFWEAQGYIVWDEDSDIWNDYTLPNEQTGSMRVYTNKSYYFDYSYNDTDNPLSSALLTSINSGDTDGDGISDGLELVIFGTNPKQMDTDQDTLNDSFEINYATSHPDLPFLTGAYLNPKKSDTDGDLLADDQEIDFGSNPANPNSDNDRFLFTYTNGTEEYIELTDYQEVVFTNTFPNSTDSDGDGLTDMQELGIWNSEDELSNVLNSVESPSGTQGTLVIYAKDDYYIERYHESDLVFLLQVSVPGTGLDPLKADTDGDGLTDMQEIFGFTYEEKTYYSHPLIADTDGDGLTDGEESNYTYTYYVFNRQTDQLEPHTENGVLDPDARDSEGDGLSDGAEVSIYFTSPFISDTDSDDVLDGQEVNGYSPIEGVTYYCNPIYPDTDGDGLNDGEELFGRWEGNHSVFGFFEMPQDFKFYSNPNNTDTDGDGLTDYQEVTAYLTNPLSIDTDDDGLEDPEDPMPVLKQSIYQLYIGLTIVAFIGSVVSVPLNRYSANKALARKFLYKEQITKATKRMAKERHEARRFEAKASLIPTSDPEFFTVKLNMKIKDRSFFGRSCRVNYSAGTQDFKKVEAKQESDEEYSFRLERIPVDTRVLYSVEFLDRGGLWIVDDNEKKFYTFATNADGTIDTHDDDDWSVDRGVKCTVCGYICLPEWDECPECNTPLHDDVNSEILLDEQEKKKNIIEKEQDLDAIAWEEAQKTDEVWRGLPPCPECGVSVQPEWANCPVCNADLTQYDLKKGAIYSWEEADMDFVEGEKTVEEIKTDYADDTSKTKSEKELLDEIEAKERKKKEDAWDIDTDDDVEVL